MFSKIVLNKENLLSNTREFKKRINGKICVMVKANAYGHGIKDVIEILKDEVDFFGVSNQEEAFTIKDICKTPVVIFGACEDYIRCMKENVSFALFSLKMAENLINIAKNNKLSPKFHLCINSGMNRYGVKNLKEFVKIINLLNKNNMTLEGVYTHFSSLTTDKNYTKRQKIKFENFLAYLPSDWNTLVHIGGGNSIFTDIPADMYRVGLGIYGYGYDFVKPVMNIKSQIVDIQEVEKGEHVGYLCSFTAKRNMRIATIPLGYADGIGRKLSNKVHLKINGCDAKSCGNICMDAMMVEVSDIRCKVGDEVLVFENATSWSNIAETTEYEILTNFCSFRGQRKIE